MTCKSLHDWLNRPDIKEWEKAPPPIQGNLFGGGGGLENENLIFSDANYCGYGLQFSNSDYFGQQCFWIT